jgi:phospholipid-transporting ATPase
MLVIMSILCSVGNLVTSVSCKKKKALCIASTHSFLYVQTKAGSQWNYLQIPATERAKEFGLSILTFMILFNSFIPISLMVTMEIVKFVQSIMIDNDLDIYYAKTDTPAVARSSSLIEELGQVEYVFSDKTGTLTCNEMEFRECSIAGLSYATTADLDRPPQSENDANGQYSFEQLEKHLKTSEHNRIIHEFMTSLMTCHTVIPETVKESDDIVYQASSPDEAALVQGASHIFGYHFYARRPHTIHCKIQGQEVEFSILNVCEFNSTRKRMSIVLKDANGIKLYCKGADSVILERLAANDPFEKATLHHLEVQYHIGTKNKMEANHFCMRRSLRLRVFVRYVMQCARFHCKNTNVGL